MADGKLVAQRCSNPGGTGCSGAATSWNYFISDHLGSTAIVLDATGAVTQRLGYDAWGRMRNANGTDDTAGSLPDAAATTRQFTGHEAHPRCRPYQLRTRASTIPRSAAS